MLGNAESEESGAQRCWAVSPPSAKTGVIVIVALSPLVWKRFVTTSFLDEESAIRCVRIVHNVVAFSYELSA